MLGKEISITIEDGDYVQLLDTVKGYRGRIHRSLIVDNELEIVDGKICISDTLYQTWFNDDLEKAAHEKQLEYVRTHANKFFAQFDYPLNKEGRGVSVEFFSENEETAKKEVIDNYKEHFREEAIGKTIKFIRYRWASEVEQFCIEKYGTAYPRKIECGYIVWSNVPFFAMPYSPMRMKMIPYLEMPDATKEKDTIRKKMKEHDETYPKLSGKRVYIPAVSEKKLDVYFQKHPELIEFREPIVQWRRIYHELLEELASKQDSKPLTPEQLELLGINFDPYVHNKYQGGKAYIELKGKRMEIAPEFGKMF